MPVVNVHVTEEGFHISGEMARQLGFRPGEDAQVEIRRAPDRDAIRQIALHYALRRLGDAVGVEEPEWIGDAWEVALKIRGRSGTVGTLCLTPDGAVLADRSATKDDLLRKLHAARSSLPTG